jgi:hypothetical protein
MLAERDHDFVKEQLANFRPVLDFFRRRLASFQDALQATEDVFRLAELQDASAESSTLAWLLFQARALWLRGDAGEPRLRLALDALGHPSAKDRDLLVLAYWDVLPEGALTALLDDHRWLVRYRLRRARKNLAAGLAPSAAGIADFVRTGGGPVATALRDADPAASDPDGDPDLDLPAVARQTLKRISDDGAVFSDGAALSDGAVPGQTRRPAAKLATRSRRRWPVLAAAVGLAAALGLAATAANGLWNQDAAQPATDSTSAAAGANQSAPPAVLHPGPRGSADQAQDAVGTASPGDTGCSIRNVATASVSKLFSTRDLTSHPEYFTLFACAGGWMAFGVSQEGRPYLAAPGPDTSFFLARLDDGGHYVFDPRQQYSIMASWQTVGAWAGQLGEGMSAPELMDRQFDIKGGPVALRQQLVGDGLSDRL